MDTIKIIIGLYNINYITEILYTLHVVSYFNTKYKLPPNDFLLIKLFLVLMIALYLDVF